MGSWCWRLKKLLPDEKTCGPRKGGKFYLNHCHYFLKCVVTSQVSLQNQLDSGTDHLSWFVLLRLCDWMWGSEPRTPLGTAITNAMNSHCCLLAWLLLFQSWVTHSYVQTLYQDSEWLQQTYVVVLNSRKPEVDFPSSISPRIQRHIYNI